MNIQSYNYHKVMNVINQVHQANSVSNGRWSIVKFADDALVYTATLIPPKTSLYAEGIFFLDIYFSTGFPVYPPRLTMTTKMYHPNVSQTIGHEGRMYVDILYSDWDHRLTVSKLMEYVYSLFSKPDLDPPSICNTPASEMYKTNREEFNRISKEWTTKYAI